MKQHSTAYYVIRGTVRTVLGTSAIITLLFGLHAIVYAVVPMQ